MNRLIQEIDKLLELSGSEGNINRLIVACMRMGVTVYGKDDPRARDPITYRKVERPSQRYYLARGYLEELKSFLINSPIQTYAVSSGKAISQVVNTTRKVFLVHGHDDALRQTVARYLERLDFEVIELVEQPNKGQTIMEKLEANADVGFVVVLLTPDDVGAKAGSSDFAPRARQNVILELGYFLGKLGRERVVPLYKSDCELPSDYHGVVYVPFDSNGGWKITLARELRSAGYLINSDAIIGKGAK